MAVEMEHTEAPPTATNGASPTKPTRRACDCCRKRKVKCDGSEPCGPCNKASIRCAYLQAPKKKGPKGLRSARVLHALRRIDDHVSGSPTSPLTPEQQFTNWSWGGLNGAATYSEQIHRQTPQVVYGPPTSIAPEQTYYNPIPTSMPQPHQQPTSHPMYVPEPTSAPWSTQSESVTMQSTAPSVVSPTPSDRAGKRLPGESFLPYMQLFYAHMFPIMPIIDRNIYLDPNFYSDSHPFTQDMYCFLCAICATTVVQLDDSIPQPPALHPTKRADALFAEECLRERRTYDYLDHMSTLSVMTSFFLFCYYGNHEKHAKAWHYLQESITFAENLNMEDEAPYAKLDPVEAQWRRRLYWLLFITERAYAVQRRKHTRLHTNVQLPSVFESEDPMLLNGFVNLANLFSAVDDNFVRAWRGSRRQSLCNEAWLAQTQKQLDAAAAALSNMNETQQLDISVTREWLHVLAWQMGVSNGLIWGKAEGGMGLDYPIELARKVVELTSGANALALDSHGIGMEQKLSDIAGCLADVLRCTAGDTSTQILEGKQYLQHLLQRLSSIRGKESRYLKPLMLKMEGLTGLTGYDLDNITLPLPTESTNSFSHFNNAWLQNPRLSMANSVDMLRSLSLSGNLGMPFVPLEDWTQRRESGRVYDEAETDAMEPWLLCDAVAQAV